MRTKILYGTLTVPRWGYHKGQGIYLLKKTRKDILIVPGITGANILGLGNKEIESQIIKQLKKIPLLITNTLSMKTEKS